VPNVNVTYGETQAAARRLQVPVIRLRAAIAVAAAVIAALSCVLSGTAMASTGPAGVRLTPVTTGANAWYVPSAPAIAATSGCGNGANVRKVVATYKARKYNAGGYRTDTLYCGNIRYGYRHLEPHIGQYFGGWASFSFRDGPDPEGARYHRGPAERQLQGDRADLPVLLRGLLRNLDIHRDPRDQLRCYRHRVRKQGEDSS